MPAQSQLPGYHNRATAGDRVEELRFTSKPLQSAELNEVQTYLQQRIAGVSTALFDDGDIIEDAEATMLPPAAAPNTFEVRDGKIFLRGAVYAIEGEQLPIPLNAKVSVGIRFRLLEVTALDDPSLRNPAADASLYQEEGAARLKCEHRWGWQAEDGRRDSYTGWDFYAIYTVDNGNLISKVPPATADPFLELLARYDRESNGNYVVSGLYLRFVEETPTHYIYELEAGVANIQGFKVERLTDQRLQFAKDPQQNSSALEPHNFNPDPDGKARIFTNRSPIFQVASVSGVKQKTESLTHGFFSGAIDELPDSAVSQVLEVKQGATVYVAGTDYQVNGDDIDWSLPGAEPAPGSTYTVTYRYFTPVTPEAVERDYFTVSGLVPGSLVQVTYSYSLPRRDALVMTRNTDVAKLKGVSQTKNPLAPIPSATQILLAEIEYDWRSEPVVRNKAVRTIPMSEIDDMRRDIFDLYDLVAQERLRTNISIRNPSSNRGVFVDAFFDNDLRDDGRENTAAIVNGILTLPILDNTASQGSNGVESNKVHTLDFILEPVVTQERQTECMKINPYQAFEPLPAKVTLTPTVDQWTTIVNVWARTVSTWSSSGSGQFSNSWTTSRVVMLSRSAVADQFIRVRPVAFTIDGFGPGETLTEVKFAGIVVTPP